MTFEPVLSEDLIKTLEKLSKKDRSLAIAAYKKIEQIIGLDEIEIMHFKNLKGDMKRLKRVHIGSHVLLFRVEGKKVIFESLSHHDDAY